MSPALAHPGSARCETSGRLQFQSGLCPVVQADKVRASTVGMLHRLALLMGRCVISWRQPVDSKVTPLQPLTISGISLEPDTRRSRKLFRGLTLLGPLAADFAVLHNPPAGMLG